MLRLYNALTGRIEEPRLARPPAARCLWAGPRAAATLEAWRWQALAGLLRRCLDYLGFSFEAVSAIEQGYDLYAGSRPPPAEAGFWLRPGRVLASPQEGRAFVGRARERGFAEPVLNFLFLKTHYRDRLEISWDRLDALRVEFLDLRGEARSLEARFGNPAAHPPGLAGYKKGFRDCLARDLGAPQAIEVLWDALRPGALSPGSRLAALWDAEQALGLGLFNAASLGPAARLGPCP